MNKNAVNDPDNPLNFVGATLTIQTTVGTERQDNIRPKTDGGLNVRIGTGVTGTTTVGTFSGGNAGADLVITFGGSGIIDNNVTAAAVDEVLQNIERAWGQILNNE